MRKMRFKQTEIGMIPEDWEVKELQEVVTKLGDGLHGTPKYDDNGEYYFINGNNLANGKIKFNENTKKCTKEEFEKYKKELNNRTILVSINGTLGNIALYQGEKIILGKSVCYLNIKNEFSVLFIKYVLKNKKFQNYIHFNATGTTIKNVSLKQMKEFKFSIPKSFNEQRAIAKILSDLDSKIEVLQKQNKTLEKIGQAIFKHWFVDFEFPNEEGKPYKSSGGEMVYNEELGKEIPKGWRVGKLGEIIENFDSKRIPLSSREREKRKGVYPYYGATKIMDYVNDYLFDGTFILMAEDGSVTNEKGFPVLQYVWGKFWANNHTHILRGNGVSTEFVYLLLSKTKISEYVTGAVQPKLNQANMNSIQILIPKSELITKFDDIIQPLFQKKRILFEQIQTLQQIRDSLLPKLMTGKIRVPVEIER